MSGTFLRVPADRAEPSSTHRDTSKRSFDLKTCQELVGGYIQRVKVRHEGRLRDAYVDEDGLSKELPINHYATALAGQVLVGPLVIWIPDPRPSRKRATASETPGQAPSSVV